VDGSPYARAMSYPEPRYILSSRPERCRDRRELSIHRAISRSTMGRRNVVDAVHVSWKTAAGTMPRA
jgi:hypothetical protein